MSIPTRWDKQNVFGSVNQLADQFKDGWSEAQKVSLPDEYKKIDRVIMSGMGGSLLGARVIDSVYGQNLKFPLILVNDYHLPSWVDEKTLVITASYSGSTEEILTNAREALAKNARLMVIAAGGELLQLAQNNHLPYYQIVPRFNPSNQPRMAIGYMVAAELALTVNAGLIGVNEAEIGQAAMAMKAVCTDSSAAEALAAKLADKQIILTAAEHLTGPVHVVKNQINENSKHLCFRHDLPELNHHLMEGLSWPKTNPQTIAFWLFDSPLYSSRMRRRLMLTKEVVEKNQISAEVWTAKAQTKLGQALELIQFGAFVAFYLSQLHELDPAPIPWVDYFKQKLSH